MRLQLDGLTERYAFCDPASGKKRLELKRTRARSAIVVIAPDVAGRIFVLHAWADRCSTNALTERIFEVNEQFRPKLFGVEANGLQSLYGDTVGMEAKRRAQRLPLTPIYQPTNIDKDFRIRAAIQPVIGYGRLFLQSHQHELRQEIVSFPSGLTKDLIDALASAIIMVPPRRTKQDQNDELDARLAYLRDTNAPMHYIEAVAAGLA